MIEDIYPEDWQKTRGIYSPAKKIDIGSCYLIFVSGQQAKKMKTMKSLAQTLNCKLKMFLCK